ncbi:protein of unknown function [Methanocaldococcus lauensis]|nr:protein of unknown function [Methanocaldococcus lauensis]
MRGCQDKNLIIRMYKKIENYEAYRRIFLRGIGSR